jgi:octaprenyl-diphosphate synthase
LQEVLGLVQSDLIRVEEELARESASAIEPVRDIAGYLMRSGGKRLRPALHLLAAKFCGYEEGNSAVRLGAILELIHNATLIHDDVIDSADMRRGRASTNSRWGNSMTVLAGDWLYMQAFSMALAERNFRILDILIGLTQSMVEGELVQLTCLGRVNITEEETLGIARRKTARLFEASTQLAAVLTEQKPETEAALAKYGMSVGMAFQIVDDLLDFTADAEQLGKPVVNDLCEGKVTLPLVYALETADGAARKKVETVLKEKQLASVQAEEIVTLVSSSGAIERTRQRAEQFTQEGLQAIASLPGSPFKRALEAIPGFILSRDY